MREGNIVIFHANQGVVKANRALAEEFTRLSQRLEVATGTAVGRLDVVYNGKMKEGIESESEEKRETMIERNGKVER